MGSTVQNRKVKVLAGTNNESGTAMYGLARAAQSKGLSAAGMELSIDELRPNHIVHVVIDGTPHFSVVREVSENSVKLADPKLGNIEMTRERFSEIFTGHALVISNPNIQVNGTDQTNQSSEDTESEDTDSGEKLASEDMQVIRGQAIKETILLAVAAAKAYAIKKAVGIAKAAWDAGVRGWGLRHKIRAAISARLPFKNHPRVQRAVGVATITLIAEMAATIPKNQWCSWGAFVRTKGAFWSALILP